MYDRLQCIMMAANNLKDKEGRPYGPRYGQLRADKTDIEMDALEIQGRQMLLRRAAAARRMAARRKKPEKGEGKYR